MMTDRSPSQPHIASHHLGEVERFATTAPLSSYALCVQNTFGRQWNFLPQLSPPFYRA